MSWVKKGLIFCPNGELDWAFDSFMTPCPWQKDDDTIRLYGGMRDAKGISRIGWIDTDIDNPANIKGVSEEPALNIGSAGMFDDNGVILGDIIEVSESELRMYYVGFQLVEKAKFLAFTGLAISNDGGNSFKRHSVTPVLDRCPKGPFIGAIHSITRLPDGTYRAWLSRGFDWQTIDGQTYPCYDCWTIKSDSGLKFDNHDAHQIIKPTGHEYRIGRPRANQRPDGSWELRATSDTITKQYQSYRFISSDGENFIRTDDVELPRGAPGDWDHGMTCYPSHFERSDGTRYLFYNGNDMGRSGVGFAEWLPK